MKIVALLFLVGCGGSMTTLPERTTDATLSSPLDGGTVSRIDTGTADDAAQPVDDLGTQPVKGSGVKFHPGHYAGSYNIIHAGDTTFSTSEIDMALSNDTVQGYYATFYWATLETAKGVYDFTVLDAEREYIATKYPGKRYGIMVWAENFGSPDKTGNGYVPKYVLADATTYGKAPDGTGGWWPMDNGGCAAWWRPAVAARLEAMFAAIAAHTSPYETGYTYDTDPYVELVTWNETATGLTAGSDYNHATAVTQWEAIDASLIATFPHTNVVVQNNYFGAGGSSEQDTSQFELASAKQGCALGGPDIIGPATGMTWGQRGYAGASGAGTSPMFGLAAYIGFVQEPDYASDKSGIADIMSVGIDTLKAAELWWTVVPEGSTYVGDWSTKVLPLLKATPIPSANKTCPTNYAPRGGCID